MIVNPDTEPLVVADPEMLVPRGQRFLLDDKMFERDSKGMPIPSLRVTEVAKIFFGQSDDWLRWRMRSNTNAEHTEGDFVLDGEPLEFKRTDSNSRYFTLADVERMAHALLQTGVIDGARATRVVTMVKTCAQLHGVIA